METVTNISALLCSARNASSLPLATEDTRTPIVIPSIREAYLFSVTRTSEKPPIFEKRCQMMEEGTRYGRNALYVASAGAAMRRSGAPRYGRNALYVASAGAAVRRLRQAVTDGKGGCSGPVVAGRLVEDMGEVIGHGFLAQA